MTKKPKPLGAVALALGVQRGEIKIEDLPPRAKRRAQFVIDSGAIKDVKPIKPARFGSYSHGPLRRARSV